MIVAFAMLAAAALPPQAHYVAMGSSFAAGPGIAPAETPVSRCARSMENYPRQLARRLSLALTDVSCSGATTDRLLGPWHELAPQIDALRQDTALVTITIGGNDVQYISNLIAAACAARPGAQPCARKPAISPVGSRQWQALSDRLDTLTAEIRRRAPASRLIFVDYPAVLPPVGNCAPLDADSARKARQTARRLARLTASAARRIGAEIISASRLSAAHHACASVPWMTGFDPQDNGTSISYHPNLGGMTAVADALERLLSPPAPPSGAH
jgi:lysophospholipase L1-like esterase